MEKRTVIYRVIDGHKIIVGFDSPTIEPVETHKAVSKVVKDTPEYQACEAKKAEHGKAVDDLRAAKKRKDNPAYQLALASMEIRQTELKALDTELRKKIVDLRGEHAVYFTPRPGEVIRDAVEVEGTRDENGDPIELGLACMVRNHNPGSGYFIALDGSMVEDNRGRVYFRKVSGKWTRTLIIKLGDKIPSDATLEGDLTEAEFNEYEIGRVSDLPTAEREKEKQKALTGALIASKNLRGELEIKSDPDALGKSQEMYQEREAKINGLYG